MDTAARVALVRAGHVFHSNHFRLVERTRLPHVGSDHLPVVIERGYEPEGTAERPRPQAEAEDHEEAQERIELGEQQPHPDADG